MTGRSNEPSHLQSTVFSSTELEEQQPAAEPVQIERGNPPVLASVDSTDASVADDDFEGLILGMFERFGLLPNQAPTSDMEVD